MNTNKSLYRITEEYLEIDNLLNEAEGVATDELVETLKINRNELNVKSESYINLINFKRSKVAFIDVEMKRLATLRKRELNGIQALKSSIEATMQVYDIDKIELPLHKLSLRKSQSIEITCEIDDLPSDCKKIKVEAISKTELKKMLKDGRKINGVNLIDNKSLQIK